MLLWLVFVMYGGKDDGEKALAALIGKLGNTQEERISGLTRLLGIGDALAAGPGGVSGSSSSSGNNGVSSSSSSSGNNDDAGLCSSSSTSRPRPRHSRPRSTNEPRSRRSRSRDRDHPRSRHSFSRHRNRFQRRGTSRREREPRFRPRCEPLGHRRHIRDEGRRSIRVNLEIPARSSRPAPARSSRPWYNWMKRISSFDLTEAVFRNELTRLYVAAKQHILRESPFLTKRAMMRSCRNRESSDIQSCDYGLSCSYNHREEFLSQAKRLGFDKDIDWDDRTPREGWEKDKWSYVDHLLRTGWAIISEYNENFQGNARHDGSTDRKERKETKASIDPSLDGITKAVMQS